MMPDRRFTAGEDATFRWVCPDPAAFATSASLAVAFAAGTSTVALSARTADVIATNGLSADRRRVTIENDDGGPLPDGSQPMPAWISYGTASQIPVRVLRVVSSSDPVDPGDPYTVVIELAEPLPHDVSLLGSVYWQVFSGTLAAPSTKQGPVRWTVTYDRQVNGATAETATDDGVLWVVRAPFATGLDSAMFIASSPWLAQHVPPGQSSWAPQIAMALDSLLVRIAARLPDGRTVNDITGRQFRNAHALETRAFILRGMAEAGIGRPGALEEVERALTAELDRIFDAGLDWVDSDGDGAIDSGETGVQASRIRLGSFTNNAACFDPSDSDAVDRTPFRRIRSDEWGER